MYGVWWRQPQCLRSRHLWAKFRPSTTHLHRGPQWQTSQVALYKPAWSGGWCFWKAVEAWRCTFGFKSDLMRRVSVRSHDSRRRSGVVGLQDHRHFWLKIATTLRTTCIWFVKSSGTAVYCTKEIACVGADIGQCVLPPLFHSIYLVTQGGCRVVLYPVIRFKLFNNFPLMCVLQKDPNVAQIWQGFNNHLVNARHCRLIV